MGSAEKARSFTTTSIASRHQELSSFGVSLACQDGICMSQSLKSTSATESLNGKPPSIPIGLRSNNYSHWRSRSITTHSPNALDLHKAEFTQLLNNFCLLHLMVPHRATLLPLPHSRNNCPILNCLLVGGLSINLGIQISLFSNNAKDQHSCRHPNAPNVSIYNDGRMDRHYAHTDHG